MPRQDIEEWADSLYQGKLGCGKRKTFGCPAYYKGKKMAAFLYEDGLCVKVSGDVFEAKRAEDLDVFQEFAPMGKPMKNWLLIVRPEASEYEQDVPLMEEAFAMLV
jgi:hypothetical protein